MKKKYMILLLSILSIFTSIYTVQALDSGIGKTSLYVWNISNIDYSSFDSTINYLNIDTLYVGNYRDLYSYDHTLLFDYAKKNKLKTYIVYGEKISNLKDVKKLVDKVAKYNNSSEYKITGLAIDSEFHTTDEYKKANDAKKKEMFKTYVDFMKESYAYAKSHNLKYVSCIPVNYDNISEELLEELIRDGADYIQVMNYNKNGMLTKIDKEVEYAKKYNKIIENIGELQEPGPNGVTDSISFWNQGLDACTSKFKEIKAHYNYDKMTFSYHAYKSVVQLAEKIMDFTLDYNYELYPKDKNGNNIKLENVYLSSDDELIKGSTVFNKNNNEYLVYFYNVKYDKEYKLSINGYNVDNKIVKYVKSNDSTKTDYRVFSVKQPVITTTTTTTTSVLTTSTNKSTTNITNKTTNYQNDEVTQEVNVDNTEQNNVKLIVLGIIFIIVALSILTSVLRKKKI